MGFIKAPLSNRKTKQDTENLAVFVSELIDQVQLNRSIIMTKLANPSLDKPLVSHAGECSHVDNMSRVARIAERRGHREHGHSGTYTCNAAMGNLHGTVLEQPRRNWSTLALLKIDKSIIARLAQENPGNHVFQAILNFMELRESNLQHDLEQAEADLINTINSLKIDVSALAQCFVALYTALQQAPPPAQQMNHMQQQLNHIEQLLGQMNQQTQQQLGQIKKELNRLASYIACKNNAKAALTGDAFLPVAAWQGPNEAAYPENFPESSLAVSTLTGEAVNTLLAFYAIPAEGTVRQRRQRLIQAITTGS